MDSPVDLIFDLDGTLVDPWQRLYGAYIQVIQSYQLTPLPFPTYYEITRFHKGHAYLLSETTKNVEKLSIEQYLKDFRTIVESDSMLKLDILYKDAYETLSYLSSSYTLHLLTKRQKTKETQQQLKQLDISKYFNTITIDSSESKYKAFQTIKRNYKDAYIIGDTDEDIEVAIKNSKKSIFASYGLRDETTITHSFDKKISSLSDLITLFPTP